MQGSWLPQGAPADSVKAKTWAGAKSQNQGRCSDRANRDLQAQDGIRALQERRGKGTGEEFSGILKSQGDRFRREERRLQREA